VIVEKVKKATLIVSG